MQGTVLHQVPIPDVEIDRSSDWPATLLFVRDYWTKKRGAQAMPSRSAISPVELKPQLPHILLADVIDDGSDFRYRLVGTQLRPFFRSEPSGKLMSEVIAPFGEVTLRETLGSYRSVIARRAPLRLTGSGSLYGQGPKHFDALLAPLSDDGETVNMIIGTFLFEWSHEYRFRDLPDMPLMG